MAAVTTLVYIFLQLLRNITDEKEHDEKYNAYHKNTSRPFDILGRKFRNIIILPLFFRHKTHAVNYANSRTHFRTRFQIQTRLLKIHFSILLPLWILAIATHF